MMMAKAQRAFPFFLALKLRPCLGSMEQETEKGRLWMENVGRENQRGWWRCLNQSGTELVKKSRRPGGEGQRVKNRAGMDKEIRNQEIRGMG